MTSVVPLHRPDPALQRAEKIALAEAALKAEIAEDAAVLLSGVQALLNHAETVAGCEHHAVGTSETARVLALALRGAEMRLRARRA